MRKHVYLFPMKEKGKKKKKEHEKKIETEKSLNRSSLKHE